MMFIPFNGLFFHLHLLAAITLSHITIGTQIFFFYFNVLKSVTLMILLMFKISQMCTVGASLNVCCVFLRLFYYFFLFLFYFAFVSILGNQAIQTHLVLLLLRIGMSNLQECDSF